MSEEEAPVEVEEEVVEERGRGSVEDEFEEVLRGFTVEGLELMLARVEEIDKMVRGVLTSSETKSEEKQVGEGKQREGTKPKSSKRARDRRKRG